MWSVDAAVGSLGVGVGLQLSTLLAPWFRMGPRRAVERKQETDKSSGKVLSPRAAQSCLWQFLALGWHLGCMGMY